MFASLGQSCKQEGVKDRALGLGLGWEMAQSSYERFENEVARFRPTELLPLVAAAATLTQRRMDDPERLLVDGHVVTPWALSVIARESIVHGSELAPRTAAQRDVERLCRRYVDLDDPLQYQGSHNSELRGFLVRTGFEQFPLQQSPFEEVARTCALYLDAAREASSSAPLLSAESWRRALGLPLEQFVAIAFILHVWSSLHMGWVDLDWLAMPQFDPVTRELPAQRIRSTVEAHLQTTFSDFRERDRQTFRAPHLEEHRFNPLEARPLLRLSGRLIAPQPMSVLSRVTSTGIYYDRCIEPLFPEQLGAVFEHYIGSHLRLIPDAHVTPEIEYAPGKKSVDWIVRFEDLALHEIIVDTCNVAIVSVDYRLAPEHPYPAGPDDCEAAACWLLEHAADEFGSDRLLIGGESAGAHLAAVTLLRMRDKHHAADRFLGANLIFGAYDLSRTPSQRGVRIAPGTDILDDTGFPLDLFLPGISDEKRRDPDVSPLYGDLRGMPPALFSVGHQRPPPRRHPLHGGALAGRGQPE